MEYDYQMPGRFGESSVYVESASGTTWLLQMALGLEVNGTRVTIAPILSGQFVVRNLHVTSQGLTAVINYARDDSGQEHIQVLSNEGLDVVAPNAVAVSAPHHFAVDFNETSLYDLLEHNPTVVAESAVEIFIDTTFFD